MPKLAKGPAFAHTTFARSSSPREGGTCRPGRGRSMPELSRFYGIVVRMYFDDDQQHSLPHVHVYYGSMDASYSLQGKLLGGKIPPKQEKLLLAWIALHEQELQENWYLLISGLLHRFRRS